jgi:hypothetical protein
MHTLEQLRSGALAGTRRLDLACDLTELPDEVLALADNVIAHLPTALGQRPALQKLMLAGNQLRALPDSLQAAQSLELLRISANRLERVPDWLTELPRLAWLALAGNRMGWTFANDTALPDVPWTSLTLGTLLGEGASGHIHRAQAAGLATTAGAQVVQRGGDQRWLAG